MNKKGVRHIKKLPQRLMAFFNSRYFLVIIVAFIFLEAMWVVFSLNIGGINDEVTHYRIAQAFSTFTHPYQVKQLPEWDSLGNISRHSSYLYYYVLGKLLNFTTLFTTSEYAKVVVLRLFNTGLFMSALIIYHEALKKIGFSRRISSFSLLGLALIPVFPLLAGQINYDNAVFLVTAVTLLLGARIVKSTKPDPRQAIWLIGVGVLGSLVKFAYVPIFVAIVLFVTFNEARKYGKKLRKAYGRQWKLISTFSKAFALGVLLLSSVMFFERYGLNTLKYGAVVPACEQVRTAESCSANKLWVRNKKLADTRPARVSHDPYKYGSAWMSNMTITMFRIDPATPPPPIAFYTFSALVFVGIPLSLLYLRDELVTPVKQYALFVVVFFIAALILQNYISVYLKTGRVIATNGRYLLPVMPLLLGFFIHSYAALFRKLKINRALVAIFITLMLLQGGGVTMHILQGNRSWFWSQRITSFNENLKDILHKVVVD